MDNFFAVMDAMRSGVSREAAELAVAQSVESKVAKCNSDWSWDSEVTVPSPARSRFAAFAMKHFPHQHEELAEIAARFSQGFHEAA